MDRTCAQRELWNRHACLLRLLCRNRNQKRKAPWLAETKPPQLWPQAWLVSLLKSLERRLHFWTSELEEIWTLWHDATARMHNAGQDAMAAWREIAEVLESVCQHYETHGHELLIKNPSCRVRW